MPAHLDHMREHVVHGTTTNSNNIAVDRSVHLATLSSKPWVRKRRRGVVTFSEFLLVDSQMFRTPADHPVAGPAHSGADACRVFPKMYALQMVPCKHCQSTSISSLMSSLRLCCNNSCYSCSIRLSILHNMSTCDNLSSTCASQVCPAGVLS